MININEYLLSKSKAKQKVVEATNNNIRELIWDAIKENGIEVDLNFIDTSKVTKMYALFEYSDFCGDISGWDVSNVTDMTSMFHSAKMFNCDISRWDVRSVEMFDSMFRNASMFNQPIGCWETTSAINMDTMFYGAEKFKQNLSGWQVEKVKYHHLPFTLTDMSSNKDLWPKFKK